MSLLILIISFHFLLLFLPIRQFIEDFTMKNLFILIEQEDYQS